MAEYTIDKFTYGGNTYKLQDNESGYLTNAVTSLNSKTGAVTIGAGDNVTVSATSNTITISTTDTKNTVGATNTASKIYLVGTTTQTTCPQSYTRDKLYYDQGLHSSVTTNPASTEISQSSYGITLAVYSYGGETGGNVTVSTSGVYIHQVVTPTVAADAANKEYVDDSIPTITAGNNITVSSSGGTITISATDTDTKNTAGATTTSSLIYLIGATATTTNPQTYIADSYNLMYSNGLYSYADYFDDNNYYTYRTALDQNGRVISLYNSDVQNNTYNTVSVSPTSINITANNPSSSVIIESPNNGTYIHNVVTPTADTDVVNKKYIDKRMNFSDADDQMWVNWYGEETAIYGQQTQSVTYSFAIHMDDNKTKLTSATLARSYNGTDWNILGTLHPTSSFSNSFVPIGTILDFAGFTPPTGYLICDGRAISRTTYADLFEILKDENDNLPWGDGDGSTTFNLPNLCGRTAIGSGTGTASDATAHALGSMGGKETHVLTPSETATKNHSHTYAKSKTSTDSHTLTTSEIPSHKHSVNERNSSGTSTGWAFMTENGKYAASGTRVVNTGGGGGHTHGIGTTATATTSNPTDANGNAHNNMQPYVTVNKIIKAL